MSIPRISRSLLPACVIASTALLAVGSSAIGSIITIQGITTGAFTTTPPASLTFAGRNFSWTTNAAGNASVVLGTFTNNQSYTTKVFNLTLDLDQPSSPPITTFTASVSSSWNGFFGNVDIFFNDTTPHHISYTTAEGNSSFDLAIKGTQNVNYPGFFNMGGTGSRDITAQISNATFVPVPEPASLALLVFGAPALLVRRRKA